MRSLSFLQYSHRRNTWSHLCAISDISLHFAYKLSVYDRQASSNMAITDSAEHALVLLAGKCEQMMHAKIALLESSVEKLAVLRKDPHEKRLAFVKIASDHEKYIIMLQQAHQDAICNVLPVVSEMNEADYAAGSWKVQDSYACNCSQWNYKHRCHGMGHFGWSSQEYVFTPVGWSKRNSHE